MTPTIRTASRSGLVILLVIIFATAGIAQSERPARLLELAPEYVSASPLQTLELLQEHLPADPAPASATPVQLRTVFDLEGSNADVAGRMSMEELQHFGRWVRLEADSRAELQRLVSDLQNRGVILKSMPEPDVSPAGFFENQYAPPAPFDYFVDRQYYMLPSPMGVDAEYAWTQLQSRGGDVFFADVEGGWNTRHADLPLKVTKTSFGEMTSKDSTWFPHGTAVVGIVAGKRNNRGVTGLAVNAKVRLYSIFGSGSGVAAAILSAAENLPAGSILLIEVQYSIDSAPSYVPVEVLEPTFDAIKQATKNGIVVVEAAGNGGLSLDKYYGERSEIKDSGAIMVGAGWGSGDPEDDFNLNWLNFSNYGSRVDVQNWGRNVVTTGYGDLHSSKGGDNNDYTASFSGTSSASAITAGACVLLQQYAIEMLGRPLTSKEMRRALVKTGTAQQGDNRKDRKIGPRPNLKKAFNRIKGMAEK